jgi:hypothetical protein
MAEFKIGDVVQSKCYPYYEFVVTEVLRDKAHAVGVSRFHYVGNPDGELTLQYLVVHTSLVQHATNPKDDPAEDMRPNYACENGQCDDEPSKDIPECEVVDTIDLFEIIACDLRMEGHSDLADSLWKIKNEYERREESYEDKN